MSGYAGAAVAVIAMLSSIATDSASAKIFAAGFFPDFCLDFCPDLWIVRIVFFLRFFDFRRVYAAAFPPVSTILFAARSPRMRCNILDKMLHYPKTTCKCGFFRRRKRSRRGRGANSGAPERLRGKRKTAHVTFYLKCYMGCRAFFLMRPCRAGLILPQMEWLVNMFFEFFEIKQDISAQKTIASFSSC
jgi:hypothetical protein